MGTTKCQESRSQVVPVGLIVCGPCACGKSEIGSALASHFQVPYVDADTYHSESNIQKMSNGIPLTDDDRFPWLKVVRQQMISNMKDVTSDSEPKPKVAVVGACSALKKIYRNILSGKNPDGSSSEDVEEFDSDLKELDIIFVYLNCSVSVLQRRINSRQGHFMKANMLASQLATLEIPLDEEAEGKAIIVNGNAELVEVIQEATEKLKLLNISN